MISRLRRHRWLAVLAMAFSPALAGQAIPLLHPCPVDQPWLAAAPQHAGMAMVMQHESHGTSHHGGRHSCICIGSCCTPAVVASPRIVVTDAPVTDAPRIAAWPVIEAPATPASIQDRLPPKTAPPVI